MRSFGAFVLLSIVLCVSVTEASFTWEVLVVSDNTGYSASFVDSASTNFTGDASDGAVANDGNEVEVLLGPVTTDAVKVTNMGFNVPDHGVVDGIQFLWSVYSSDTAQDGGTTKIIHPVDGFIDPVSSTALWPAFNSIRTFGGSDELHGATWDPSDVNDPGFGMQISATGLTAINTFRIDGVSCAVTYSLNVDVTSISPTTGPSQGGGVVELWGTGFDDEGAVDGDTMCVFPGVSADPVIMTVVNNTYGTCAIPATSGASAIEVSIDGGFNWTTAENYYIWGEQVNVVESRSPSAVSLNIDGSGRSWSADSATSAYSSDDSYLSAEWDFGAESSRGFQVTGYNFALPPTPITSITGVAAWLEHWTDDRDNIASSTVVLMGDGWSTSSEVQNSLSFTESSSANTLTNYGDATGNLWGYGSWSAEGVNHADFGLEYDAIASDYITIYVDWVNLQVQYSSYISAENPLSPSSGFAPGGITTTITGAGFADPDYSSVTYHCRFDGSEVTTGAYISETEISCTTPALAAGTSVSVELSIDGGTTWQDHGLTFTVSAEPLVASAAPMASPVGGGGIVFISGSGFLDTGVDSLCRWDFATTAALSVSHVASASCTAPTWGSAETVDLEISFDGGSTWLTVGDFHFHDTVTVSTFSPSNDIIDGGAEITVTGTNFVESGGGVCRWSGDVVTDATWISSTQVTCTAPAAPSGSAGYVTLEYSNNAQNFSTVAPNTLQFVSPTVQGLDPAQGPAAGGEAVTITGTGFLDTDDFSCRFGADGIPQTATWITETQASCEAPDQGALTLDTNKEVFISNNGQTWSTASDAPMFLYAADPVAGFPVLAASMAVLVAVIVALLLFGVWYKKVWVPLVDEAEFDAGPSVVPGAAQGKVTVEDSSRVVVQKAEKRPPPGTIESIPGGLGIADEEDDAPQMTSAHAILPI